jgi:hypothetical protein
MVTGWLSSVGQDGQLHETVSTETALDGSARCVELRESARLAFLALSLGPRDADGR